MDGGAHALLDLLPGAARLDLALALEHHDLGAAAAGPAEARSALDAFRGAWSHSAGAEHDPQLLGAFGGRGLEVRLTHDDLDLIGLAPRLRPRLLAQKNQRFLVEHQTRLVLEEDLGRGLIVGPNAVPGDQQIQLGGVGPRQGL